MNELNPKYTKKKKKGTGNQIQPDIVAFTIWSVLLVSDFSGDRFILGPLQLFIITSLAMFLHCRDCRVDSALEISTIVASIATNKATRMPRIFAPRTQLTCAIAIRRRRRTIVHARSSAIPCRDHASSHF